MTDNELLQALRDCYDHFTHRNVVDLHLVRSAHLTPDTNAPGPIPRFHAEILLTAPSADEAATSQLAAQIENRLMGLQPISRVTITTTPPLFSIL